MPSGRSAPETHRCVAPGFIPAFLSTSATRTPVHFAVPTAPFFHWMPATGGSKKARPLPAHSSVTVTEACGSCFRSATESDTGAATSPSIASDQPASAVPAGTGMWQRT